MKATSVMFLYNKNLLVLICHIAHNQSYYMAMNISFI
jgi:hypothetical protein